MTTAGHDPAPTAEPVRIDYARAEGSPARRATLLFAAGLAASALIAVGLGMITFAWFRGDPRSREETAVFAGMGVTATSFGVGLIASLWLAFLRVR